ncbi:MAG: bifunctional [glutamine synthetase] adenylyltransferase/[glutamine synthetase]-adenylyl-L-tyrosine phosphorylase [Kiloniellales bacterium]
MPSPLSLPDSAALPLPRDRERIALGRQHWAEALERLDDPEVARRAVEVAADPAWGGLIDGIFSGSNFLGQALVREMGTLTALALEGPEATVARITGDLKCEAGESADPAQAGAALRCARRRLALAVGLADLGGLWSVIQVMTALSEFADRGLSLGIATLLRQAAGRGDLELADPAHPLKDCGYVLIGLGKLGARELNYSSDVDFIVLFDPEIARYRHSRGPQEGYVRMTRDLVRLVEDRTAEGYAFRTDLRLRPDPGAMPLAISVNSAMSYYESLGQNWERAAMIKARPVAGDLELGRRVLAELTPFIWRKHLDFWAIQDIHSIKRQIQAHKGGAAIAVAGHNIKLGRGGIREIEFFAQVQQLIWGGRDPTLREPRTLEALSALAEAGHLTMQTAKELSGAYCALRDLEHRLQMVDDQQTHSLPASDEGLAAFAAFAGHETTESFRSALLGTLHCVEDRYAELFEEAPSLSGPGNLVFTGGEPDPDTVKTLEQLGFADGAKVFALVRSWHHGRHRCTRTTRSRQILTEIMPTLLEALGRTAQPEQALLRFDEFLAGLPAGVQLFSMLHANPSLLTLLAEILGGAPALAERLSRKPDLLEAVLSLDFFGALPDHKTLESELDGLLALARDFEDVLTTTRRWANDRRFQVGVHILRGASDVDACGRTLSDIAEVALSRLHPKVVEDFARQHGRFPGAGLAVIALGKLGGREMTVSSDLDLVFLYDREPTVEQSDGAKPLPVILYFTRLAQRFINAVTALTGEGALYQIDMRLRPSGNKGPIATSLGAFERYHESEAWTWERMALTRARVIVAEEKFGTAIESAIRAQLTRASDPAKLVSDVAEMRARIARERPGKSPWDVKDRRGGLVDLEFLAQYLLLRHAPETPELLTPSTQGAFKRLGDAGLLPEDTAGRLISATRLCRQLQGFLRLVTGGELDEAKASDSLTASLANAAGALDFADLKRTFEESASAVQQVFAETIEAPATAAGTRLKKQKS